MPPQHDEIERERDVRQLRRLRLRAPDIADNPASNSQAKQRPLANSLCMSVSFKSAFAASFHTSRQDQERAIGLPEGEIRCSMTAPVRFAEASEIR